MAQENVATFEKLLRTDEALQAKVTAAARAYAGVTATIWFDD